MTSVNTTGLLFWKLTTRWSTCNSKIKKISAPEVQGFDQRIYCTYKPACTQMRSHCLPGRWYSFLSSWTLICLPLFPQDRQCLCMSSPFKTSCESSFYSEPCDGAEKRIPYDVVSFFPPWHYSLLARRHLFKSHHRMLMRYIPPKHLGL